MTPELKATYLKSLAKGIPSHTSAFQWALLITQAQREKNDLEISRAREKSPFSGMTCSRGPPEPACPLENMEAAWPLTGPDAMAPPTSPVRPISPVSPAEQDMASVEEFEAYFNDDTVMMTGDHTAPAPKPHSSNRPPAPGNLLLLLDGASTCWVIMDERLCTNVRSANIRIKVGSNEGKPTFVTCNKVGVFPFSKRVGGQLVTLRPEVRICPGFGCNIMPESAFLSTSPPHRVNKVGTQTRILSHAGTLVMTAQSRHYDASWLAYTEVTPLHPADQGGKLSYAPDSINITKSLHPAPDRCREDFPLDRPDRTTNGPNFCATSHRP